MRRWVGKKVGRETGEQEEEEGTARSCGGKENMGGRQESRRREVPRWERKIWEGKQESRRRGVVKKVERESMGK
jgi:hypothetical protein